MNILIVGNGFDLSHYLPTKYDHFMVAMDAIENWEISKGDMGFDDIFGSLYKKEDYFFGYTKAMYKTDEIKISVDQIKKLKEQLKENVWYQFFLDHVKEVKTWIDFELKIKEALEIVCEFMVNIELYLKKKNSLEGVISLFKNSKGTNYFLSQKNIRVLELLNILKVVYYKDYQTFSSNATVTTYENDWLDSEENISELFFKKMKGFDEYNFKDVTLFLRKSLIGFSALFNY